MRAKTIFTYNNNALKVQCVHWNQNKISNPPASSLNWGVERRGWERVLVQEIGVRKSRMTSRRRDDWLSARTERSSLSGWFESCWNRTGEDTLSHLEIGLNSWDDSDTLLTQLTASRYSFPNIREVHVTYLYLKSYPKSRLHKCRDRFLTLS